MHAAGALWIGHERRCTLQQVACYVCNTRPVHGQRDATSLIRTIQRLYMRSRNLEALRNFAQFRYVLSAAGAMVAWSRFSALPFPLAN